MKILHEKSKKLLSSYPGYKPQWLALGIEDISRYGDAGETAGKGLLLS